MLVLSLEILNEMWNSKALAFTVEKSLTRLMFQTVFITELQKGQKQKMAPDNNKWTTPWTREGEGLHRLCLLPNTFEFINKICLNNSMSKYLGKILYIFFFLFKNVSVYRNTGKNLSLKKHHLDM